MKKVITRNTYKEIKKDLEDGYHQRLIANWYYTSQPTVCRINKSKSYKGYLNPKYKPFTYKGLNTRGWEKSDGSLTKKATQPYYSKGKFVVDLPTEAYNTITGEFSELIGEANKWKKRFVIALIVLVNITGLLILRSL